MPNRKYLSSYIAFAIPVMFIGILPTVTQNIDKVMIQFFWSSTDVGYYIAVQRISYVLSYLSIASISLLFPTISSYYSKGNIDGIRQLSNGAERYLSMILFPAVAFIVVFSEPVTHVLLGAQFLPSAPILVTLAIVALVHGTTQPYTQQLGGTNNIALAARVSGVVFGANVLLNLLFIPKEVLGFKVFGMGALGASFATLVSICIGVVLFRFYAFKITRSKPNPRILYHLVAALIMAITIRVISDFVPAMSWYLLILFGCVGTATYIVVLSILGEFAKADLHFFTRILNPTNMIKYAKSEIQTGYVRRLIP
jgi:O-antigen/teichoic acid export membrane protein